MESWLFLALVLLIAIFGHNSSLIIATVVVMVLKLIPYTAKWLPLIQHKGINWGVTVISVAILIPIATGQIGFDYLWAAFKLLLAGLRSAWALVAILSKYGVNQLAAVPQVSCLSTWNDVEWLRLRNCCRSSYREWNDLLYCNAIEFAFLNSKKPSEVKSDLTWFLFYAFSNCACEEILWYSLVLRYSEVNSRHKHRRKPA